MQQHIVKHINNVPFWGMAFVVFLSAMFCCRSLAADSDYTLHLFFWQAPTMLNPHLTGGFKDLNAARVTYEPLASFDKDGNLISFLAAEIPSLENGGVAPDGRSVTWKLKPGIKWSDGHPFTADDMLFTYEFITNLDTNAVTVRYYSHIKNVEVIDNLTVRINFNRLTPDWAGAFVGRNGMILPRHIFEGYNNTEAREAPANLMPVGTGPYRLVEYNTEDMLIIGDDMVNVVRVIYEPNPFFREKDKPYFRRVELRGGGDTITAAQAVLVEGTADFAWNLQVDPEMLAEMEAAGKGSVISVPGPSVERILLNRTDPNRETETGERSSLRFPHPFFSDKKVRQAFAHAIDRKAIAALYGDTAHLTTNILVSPSGYNSSNTANLYPFDLERARGLLDEASWIDTDGDGIRDKEGIKLSVVFQTSVNPVRQQTQEIIEQALETIGVEVELKVIDASIFFSANPSETNSGRHFYADMEEYYIGNSSPDPGDYMQLWMCDQILQQANNWAGGGNVARWCNPEYDALHTRSTIELDSAKRTQLFIQMNDMLVEDVAAIPLVNKAEINGVSNTLEGIEFNPWDTAMWDIKNWQRKKSQ